MSYAVVDRENLVFLPFRHDKLEVVCNLCWIEANHLRLHIFDVYAQGALKLLTDMELLILYKNTTGLDKAPRFGDSLRRICVELAQRIPHTVVEAHRLHMQAEALGDDHSGRYRYDPKGFRAIQEGDLFSHEPVRIPPAPNENQIANQPIAAAPARPLAALVLPALANTTASPANSTSASAAPKTPWDTKPATAAKVAWPSDAQILAPWLKK